MSLRVRIRKRHNRSEPILLLSRRHNYFPKRFLWRGKEYDVAAIERAWTEIKRGGKVKRYFFRVKCAEGTFDLYQDILLNAWYVER